MYPLAPIIFLVVSDMIILVFGLWVFYRNPRSRVNVAFFGLVLTSVIWSIPHIFLQFPEPTAEWFKFWINMNFIGPVIFLSFFVYFSYIFPENRIKLPWWKVLLVTVPPVVIVPSAFFQEIASYVAEPKGYIEWGFTFYLFYFFFFLYFLWGVINFYRKLGNRNKSDTKALMIIFVGLSLGALTGVFFSGILPIIFKNERFLYLGPSLGGLFFMVSCGYAIIRYDLMDIKIIAKRAFFYGVITVVSTMLLSLVVIISRFLEDQHPSLSVWLIPAVFSVLAVLLGFYIWNAIHIAEALKHEFVTVVTHKFRTPLTHIMWSIEDLKMDDLTDKQRENVRAIENSSKSVIELVNLLTEVSEGKDEFTASRRDINLSDILREALKEQKQVAERKGIELEERINEEIIVSAEKKKLRFVINVLIENALTYTPSGGKITVTLVSDGSRVRLKVKDNGIGMSKGTQELVFSTFFRGDAARSKYTEGMGVGLYITKNIIDDFGGDTGFFSEGEGKGSTFYVELPVVDIYELGNYPAD
ncbi:MAG: ATP-binding protein [Candidatus Paceibacterota bacterium]